MIYFFNWGIWDWDYQQTLLEVSRRSILKYHQLPLWNPFIGGGITLAGNTLIHAWGPCFIPILLFGTIIGIKVCIFLYLLLAQSGMFLLARYQGLAKESAFLSAILYTLGGVYAHRLTHGHFEWIAIAWIPFIVLMIHKNIKRLDRKSLCLGGIFLAFLFLDGGPYQFAFLTVFLGIYTTFLILKFKNLRLLITLALIFFIGISLASIKLFPVYERVKKYPREVGEINFNGAPFTPTAIEIVNQMFLSRNQNHRSNAWMPYILNVGCYVGWVPLILAFTAIIMRPQRNWPIFLTAFILSWIMLGPAVPLNLWGALHNLPGLSLLQIPSRFNVFVLFLLALLSGEGIQILKEKLHKMRWSCFLPVLIVAIITVDLIWVNGKVFNVAFSVPSLKVQPKDDFKHYLNSPYFEKYEQRALYKIFPHWPSAAFPAVLENRGVIDNFSTIEFTSYAFPFEHPWYRGESWIKGEKGRITSLKITPNRIWVETNGLGEILFINQNYDYGWKARGEKPLKIFSIKGTIAIELPPGQKRIELVYLPDSFRWGAFISLAALLITLIVIFPHIIKNIKALDSNTEIMRS